jgi:hypothetical protein
VRVLVYQKGREIVFELLVRDQLPARLSVMSLNPQVIPKREEDLRGGTRLSFDYIRAKHAHLLSFDRKSSRIFHGGQIRWYDVHDPLEGVRVNGVCVEK